VAVDTGLGHLAAALDVPTISLFGPTNPGLTGAYGKAQIHLASDFPCAPCLQKKCTYNRRRGCVGSTSNASGRCASRA
jgi:heptosyltransferase-1